MTVPLPLDLPDPLPRPEPPPGPVKCTAGLVGAPCPNLATPGCELDGYPACRPCFDDAVSYACPGDGLDEP